MKAIWKTAKGAGAEIREAKIPEITSHQVLVKIMATSICGTDLHIYNWDKWSAGRIKPPMIFGHEFSGEVIEIGSQVNHVKVGDHVSAETHIPCGGCFQCRTGQMHICRNLKILGVDCDGCFTQYIAVPEICCIINDKNMPWEIASVQEPIGNAMYCVSESNVAGKSVAIFGDGPTGVFATGIARAYGATKIIVCGMQRYRLDIISKYKPDLMIDVSKTDARTAIMEFTKGEGVDVILEMSGSEAAIHDGLRVVKKGGVFTAFGIPKEPVRIDMAEDVIFKGIRLIAINGRKMFGTWFEVAGLINSNRLDVSHVLTHEFPLEKFNDAMELLNAREVMAGKIILKP
jgi:threonine 3-dehydrogenase